MLSRSALDRLVRAAVLRSSTLPASASFHAAAASGRVAATGPPHGAAVLGRTRGRAGVGAAHRPLAQVVMGRGWGVRAFADTAKTEEEEDEEEDFPTRKNPMDDIGEGSGGNKGGKGRPPTEVRDPNPVGGSLSLGVRGPHLVLRS